jgi:hypothetical protein
MAPAQFNEFLRSMQRTFEDGISKGFVRGTDEIAGNLAFLSGLNGGSELWKGEQGANRLSQINSSIQQATNLESTTDILIYRGAQNVLEGYTDNDWKKLLDVDNDGVEDIIKGRGSSEYVNPMLLINRGLTPELFNESMKMFNTADRGDYASVLERMNKGFNLDYTQSAQLYKSWTQNKDTPGYFDSKEFKRELEKYSGKPPENNSTELTMLSSVADTKKYTYDIGQWHLDQKMPLIADELKKAWQEAYGKGTTRDPDAGKHANPYPPPAPPEKPATPGSGSSRQAPKPIWMSLDTSGMPPSEAFKVWQQEYDDASKSGDWDRINNATRNLEFSRKAMLDLQHSEDPFYRETRELGMNAKAQADVIQKAKSTRYLFSEHLGDNFNPLKLSTYGKSERQQMTAINKTIEDAAKSGDPVQFNAAKEVAEFLSRYGKDEKTGKPYNEANTFNSLSEFSGDIIKMLSALRSLIEIIDSTEVTVYRED